MTAITASVGSSKFDVLFSIFRKFSISSSLHLSSQLVSTLIFLPADYVVYGNSQYRKNSRLLGL